jgi:hypothetical protein
MRPTLRALLFLAPLATWFAPFDAAMSAEGPAPLSERVGVEIDEKERTHYGLFPDVIDFGTARFDSTKQAFRITYTESRGGELRSRSRSVGRDAFEQTRWHVAFTDEYEQAAAGDSTSRGGPPSEADLLRRLTLRYAARKEYRLARTLASDLSHDFAAEPSGVWATDALPRLDALAGPRRALIWSGSLLDQRGRSDLLVFSGYYGLWLGIAIPVALEAEDAQAYAAGLLAVPAISILLANQATRDASITKGQARIIATGGLLGTFQGLGWAGLSDADGNRVVAAGVAAGLAGVAIAIPLTHAVHFTEGHGEITNSAMWWGGWFGLVESEVTNRSDESENSPLVDMLVGSDVGVLTGAIAGSGARLSEGRMRLINLSGVLGTAFGGGLILLAESDEGSTNMAILGAGSIAGLALGIHWTRNYDAGKDLAAADDGPAFEPVLSMRAGAHGKSPVPAMGLRIRF